VLHGLHRKAALRSAAPPDGCAAAPQGARERAVRAGLFSALRDERRDCHNRRERERELAERKLAEGGVHDRFNFACEQGRVDDARRCLEHGADPVRKSDWGTTPLTAACSTGQVATATLCLDHGVSVEQRCDSVTPLHVASIEGPT